MYLLLLAGILSLVGNLEPSKVLGWIVFGLVVSAFLLINRAYWKTNPHTDHVHVAPSVLGDDHH